MGRDFVGLPLCGRDPVQGRDHLLGLGVRTLTPVMATNSRTAEVGPESVR